MALRFGNTGVISARTRLRLTIAARFAAGITVGFQRIAVAARADACRIAARTRIRFTLAARLAGGITAGFQRIAIAARCNACRIAARASIRFTIAARFARGITAGFQRIAAVARCDACRISRRAGCHTRSVNAFFTIRAITVAATFNAGSLCATASNFSPGTATDHTAESKAVTGAGVARCIARFSKRFSIPFRLCCACGFRCRKVFIVTGEGCRRTWDDRTFDTILRTRLALFIGRKAVAACQSRCVSIWTGFWFARVVFQLKPGGACRTIVTAVAVFAAGSAVA